MEFRRGGGVHDYGILRAWGGLCSFFNQGNAVFEVLIRKIKVQSSIIMCSVLVVACVAGGFYGWAHRKAGHEGQNEGRCRGEMGRGQRVPRGEAAR